MCLGKFPTDHHATLDKRSGGGNLVPLRSQIQDNLDRLIGGFRNCHHRLGQNRQTDLTGGDVRLKLGGGGVAVVNENVFSDRQTVFLAQVRENERRVLCGNRDGLSAQVGERRNSLIRAIQQIQHTAGVEGEKLNLALGLIVKNRGGVGRQGGNINLSLNQPGRHIGGIRLHREVVVQTDGAVGGALHQRRHAESGGSAQNGHIDVQRLVYGRLLGAGKQTEGQNGNQKNCQGR